MIGEYKVEVRESFDTMGLQILIAYERRDGYDILIPDENELLGYRFEFVKRGHTFPKPTLTFRRREARKIFEALADYFEPNRTVTQAELEKAEKYLEETRSILDKVLPSALREVKNGT